MNNSYSLEGEQIAIIFAKEYQGRIKVMIILYQQLYRFLTKILN